MSNDSGGAEPPPSPTPNPPPVDAQPATEGPSMTVDESMEALQGSSPEASVESRYSPSLLSTNVLEEASAGVMVPPLERAAQMGEGKSPGGPPSPAASSGASALVKNLANLQLSSRPPPRPEPSVSPAPVSSPPVGLDTGDENQRLMLALLGVDPDMVELPTAEEEVPVSVLKLKEDDEKPSEAAAVDEPTEEGEEGVVAEEAPAVEGPVWKPRQPYDEVEKSEVDGYEGTSDRDLRQKGMKRLKDGSVVRYREASATGGEFVRCSECGKWRLRPRSPDGKEEEETPLRVTCSSFVATTCEDPCDWITSMLDAVELLPLILVEGGAGAQKVGESKQAETSSTGVGEKAEDNIYVKSEAQTTKKAPELLPGKRATAASGGKKSAVGAAVKPKAPPTKGAAAGRSGKVGRPRKATTSTPKTKPAPSPESPSSLMNSWVQCDCCRRWRMISAELAKAKEGRDQIFVCSELPGKSCEDPCDWVMDTQSHAVVAGEGSSPPGVPRPSTKGGSRKGSSSRQSPPALMPNSSPDRSSSSVTREYPEQGSESISSSSPPPGQSEEDSTVQVSVDAVECLLDWDEPKDRYYVKWKGADVQLGDWEPASRLLEVPEEMKAMARKEGSRWSSTSVSLTDARRKRARTTFYTDMRAKRQEELIAAAARQPGEAEGPSTAPTVSPAPPMMPDITSLPAAPSTPPAQASAAVAGGVDPTVSTAAAAAGVTAISHTALEHPRVSTARPKAKSRMQARKQAMLAAKHRQQKKEQGESPKAPVKEEKVATKKEESAKAVKASAATPKKGTPVEAKQEGTHHKSKTSAKGKRSLKKAKDAKEGGEVDGSMIGSEKGGRKKASTPKASKAKGGKKRGRGRPLKNLFSEGEEEEDTPDIEDEIADQSIAHQTPKKKRSRTAAEGPRTPKSGKVKKGSETKAEVAGEDAPMKSPKSSAREQAPAAEERADTSEPLDDLSEKPGKRRRSALKALGESSDEDEEVEEDEEEEAAAKRRKRKKKHEGKKLKHKKSKKAKAEKEVDADAKAPADVMDAKIASVSYPMPTGKVPTLHHRADTFMLCVKPVGCSIETAIAWAKALIASEEGEARPEDVELIAGVLDEEYSGLCLFGLSASTNAFLKEQARTQTLCLGYLCVIAGRPPAPNGLLHGSLGCSYTTVATMTDENTGKMQYALIYVNATPHGEGSLPLLPPHIKLASADTHSLLYYGLKGSGRSTLVHASRLAFYPPVPNSPHTPIPIAGFEIPVPPEYAEFLRFAGDAQTNWEPLKVSMSCNRFAHVGPDHWVVGGSRQGQAASVCFPSGYCPSCFTVYPSFSSRQVCNKCSEAQTLLAVPWARHVTYQQAASNLLTAQQPEHVLHNQHEINQAAAALENAKANDEGRGSEDDPSVQLRRHVITTVRLNFESRGQGFAGGVGVLISDVEAQLDAELPTWRDAVPHSGDSNRVGLRGLLGDTEPERRAQGIMKIYLPFEALPRLAQHPDYISYMHSQMLSGPSSTSASQKGSGSRWQQYHHHKSGTKWSQGQQHYKGGGEWGGHKGGGDWKYKGAEWAKKGGGGDWHRGGSAAWAPTAPRPQPARNWTSSYDQYLHHHTTTTEPARPTSAATQKRTRPLSASSPAAGEGTRGPSPARVAAQQADRPPPQMSPMVARAAAVAAARDPSWSNRPSTGSLGSPAPSPAVVQQSEGTAGSPAGVQGATSEMSVLASPASGLGYAPSNPEMSPAAMSEPQRPQQQQQPTVPLLQQQQQLSMVRPQHPQVLGALQVPEVALSEADVRAIVQLTALIRQRCGTPMLAPPPDGSAPQSLHHGEGPSSSEPPRDPREAVRRAGSAARSGGGASTRARSSHSRTPPPRRRNEDRERNRMYYRSPDKSRSSPRGGRGRRRRTGSDSESRSRSIVARRRRTPKSGGSLGEAPIDSGSMVQAVNAWSDPGGRGGSGGWDHHGGGDGGWNTGGKGRSAWHRKAH